MLEFQVSNQAGQAGAVDVNQLVSELREAGYNPQGASADGMVLTLADAQGTYQVKTTDMLQELGWKVMDARPAGADYSTVQPEWRAAVSALPHDDARRAYIEGQMRRLGHQDPQVTGSGRDWYVFNPSTSSWVAATNNPDWDKSDLTELGVKAPRIGASIAGGALGALGGGGAASIATGALGAGAAGTAADGAVRSYLARNDPVLGDVSTRYADDIAKEMLFEGGMDTLFAGAGGILGKVAPALMKGPLSTAARGTGAVAEGLGTGVAKAAGALDTPLGRNIGAAFIPGVAEADALSFLLQAPRFLAQKIPAAVSWIGRKTGSEGLENAGARALRPSLASRPRGDVIAEEMAAKLSNTGQQRLAYGPKQFEPSAAEIGSNVTGDLAEKVGKTADEAVTWRKRGAQVGRGMDTAGNAGDSLNSLVQGVMSGIYKGARAAGLAGQHGGRAMRRAGTVLQPVENRVYARAAAEEGLPDFEPSVPWQQRSRGGRIPATLVGNTRP